MSRAITGNIPALLLFENITDEDLEYVGPKAANLAKMARVGLPVPDGFAVTCVACRSENIASFNPVILQAYHQLGRGRVAVRSSAVAEDTEGSSFAGQQESFLNVEGDDALMNAIRECRDSIYSERATAYRKAMGVGEDAVDIAVVVQRMVDSDTAGVLFTCDPMAPDSAGMMVEGVWGLGEALVSGRVTPDRWTLDHSTGDVRRATIADKPIRIGRKGERPVDPDLRTAPVLNPDQLRELARLGRAVEALYGAPQDIEWAWEEGGFRLLQARPITVGQGDQERVRREEIAALDSVADPSGTVWARYSVAEVLPEPLPYTWALWKSFMSAGSGYGKMYRELGFDPDPALNGVSVLDLIAGRPYFNLSREARLYFHQFPQDYPFAKLKADPACAIYPRLEANLARAGKGFLFKALGVTRRMMQAEKILEKEANELPNRFEAQVLAPMKRAVAEARARNLADLTDEQIMSEIRSWRRLLFDTYLPQSLKPSVLAGLAIEKLAQLLKPTVGEAQASIAAESMLAGAMPDAEYDMPAALRRLAAGEMSRDAFLEAFGHRGSGEMELALPRWRETPDQVPLQSGSAPKVAPADDPVVLVDRLLAGRRPAVQQAVLSLERARRFTALREAAKHGLMLGYEVLRGLLLEADRRLNLEGGIFYLEPDELEAGSAPDALRARISDRRRRRALALGLYVPRVIFSDDLDAIGRPVAPREAQECFVGTGVSGGLAQGPALVLRAPNEAPPDVRDFVLVCPSTDPGWVPLFLRARAVVLETGGVLSHGAIVAREFGLPAVANISDACTLFKNGQILRVDGTAGQVHLI